MTNRKKRISELETEIREHRDSYYNGTPRISDDAYDALEDELRELDPGNAVLAETGAEPPSGGWDKEGHRFFMTSLNKARDPSEFREWAEKIPGPSVFCWSEKMDGISLALNYEDGELVSAVTRGDGTEGENIMANAVLFEGVRRELRTSFTGVVRGEVVLPIPAWREHLDGYSNPRNAAAGISRVEDRSKASNLCPHLKVFAYDIMAPSPPFDTEREKYLLLQDWDLKVPGHGFDLDSDEVVELYRRYQSGIREELQYDIDGLVIRVPEVRRYNKAGEYNNRPMGAVAMKFPNEGKATVLRNVSWDVGNTGRITPVAKFDPVELVGAEVRQASLYNAAYIRKMGLCVGDEVYVERANDVIPRVEEKLAETGDEKVVAPEECPQCGAETEWDGEYLVCPDSEECPAQAFGDLKRWIESLNVMEWGEFVLKAVLEEGLAEDPADLYRLEVSDLSPLTNDNGARLGESRARTLVEELRRRSDPTLSEFLGGLNIPSFRRKTAEKVVDYAVKTTPDEAPETEILSEILNISESQLTSIRGIGPKTASGILDGLESKTAVVGRLLAEGVDPELPGGQLDGLSFCITGRLSRTRSEVEGDITASGGSVTGVRKDLDYLVTNNPESTSSKATQAREYGIPFVSEDELYEMM